ncbi:MAG: hypothetical protein AB8I08_18460 [Sandaracinaceae bacterium]
MRNRGSWIAMVLLMAGACGDTEGSVDGGGSGTDSGSGTDGGPPPVDLRDMTLDQAGVTTSEASVGNLGQITQRFDMPGPIAPTQRWTQRTNGLCGQRCRNGPRHMYTAAFEDTLLVSWMSVDPDDAWRQYGNVATFHVSDDGEFTLVRNVAFDGMCEATYGIEANADGSVIAVLCRGIEGETEPLADATNLLDRRRTEDCTEEWEGRCYPIGNFSSHDSGLYLMEFTGGEVTSEPDSLVYVNHAVGGWRYGHHELMLNAAEDTYFVHLKVTAGPSADNRHEGMTRFGIRRTPEFEYVRINDEWGCGAGHVTTNRMAYNRSGDMWSQVCQLDTCPMPSQFSNNRCDSVSFSTVTPDAASAPSMMRYEGAAYLLEMEVTERGSGGANRWTMTGGVTNVLSLGADGWLALAAGPGYAGAVEKPETIGLIRLPLSMDALTPQALMERVPQFEGGTQVGEQDAERYPWNWLYLPETQTDAEPRVGMANMAYFSPDGEDSERLLVGWSPSTATQGITAEYVVSELDREGRLRGEPLRLMNAGWGEDNRWATMPGSGCVVFPFAWAGDAPGNDYPIESNDRVSSDFPTTLHMTAICPSGDGAPELTPQPDPVPDRERWPAP